MADFTRLKNLDLFAGAARMNMDEAIELTRMSLMAHGPDHDHWAVAYSGGKDSSATLTLLMHLLDTGQVPRPRRLTVLYADTRMELPPLAIAAARMLDMLAARGIETIRVCAPLDRRFMVYMLGRGVPPPNNGTLRWCTPGIKIAPMEDALRQVTAEGSILMITGVRQGESAIRDRRIEMSCSAAGAECGQGWYQTTLPNSPGLRGRIATLAPLLHWRVCLVWEWLRVFACSPRYGAWPTDTIADAYGSDEAEEANARTGCIGCPLASRDLALEMVVKQARWCGLAPLLELKPLYRELRLREHRIRKADAELRRDGTRAANPQRMGPLKLASRLWALDRVLGIQRRCRPQVDLIDGVEEARIRELIAAQTWPDGWDGTEPSADQVLPFARYQDGAQQFDMLAAAGQ